jgi:hypothetical protein
MDSRFQVAPACPSANNSRTAEEMGNGNLARVSGSYCKGNAGFSAESVREIRDAARTEERGGRLSPIKNSGTE